jgi:TonB family protein
MGNVRGKTAELNLGAIMMSFLAQYGSVFLLAITPTVATAGDRSQGAHPLGNPGAFFGPDAYPAGAIRNQEQGRVVAEILVNANGAATKCTVATSSGSTALDDATCAIAMEKVRYAAAADARGQPIAGPYQLSVRWVLPAPTPAGSKAQVTFGGTRDEPTCSMLLTGGAQELPSAECKKLRSFVESSGVDISGPVLLDVSDGAAPSVPPNK